MDPRFTTVSAGNPVRKQQNHGLVGISLAEAGTPTAAAPDTSTWNPATAKGVLELFGKELGMFIDRKIIGIK